jgi:4-alpha-glucanotransferase
MTAPVLGQRRAGVLCHITSLPGAFRHGTLGDHALRFLDFLQQCGFSLWQMLPLNPPDRFGSPYCSASLFAIDASLLDPALGLDDDAALRGYADRNAGAFERFRATATAWLDDFCRYRVASRIHGADWASWPPPLRRRDTLALQHFDTAHRRVLDQLAFAQFAAHHEFVRLREAAAARDIVLFGDMPLYPAFESADVWSEQRFFELDHAGRPQLVAGVPPDYFSATGQLWGNPVYAWDALEQCGFQWWVHRLTAQLALFDVVRVDHFRGLQAYWAIPRDATSARAGSWYPAPGRELLTALEACFAPLPIAAEDLGVITPEVDALREAFGLPGMRVLQFAFSGDADNPHLPANYTTNTIAYTGTHDNDTTLGWYRSLPDALQREVVRFAAGPLPQALLRVLWRCRANTAIVPMQDLLALDSRHRMNTPGRAEGNWRWRFEWAQLDAGLAVRIRENLSQSDRV